MLLHEITGRALHSSGHFLVDRREGTPREWEYQAKMMFYIEDLPDWSPVPEEAVAAGEYDWPTDGWVDY